MRLLPSIFLLLFLLPTSAHATTYFVRTDGSNSGCTGLVDAAYDGSGTGEPCAFATVPTAISASVCGDTIHLKTGQTFDTASPITLANKSCTSTPITITSTGFATPSGTRVSPSDASSMAKVRGTSTGGTFVDVAGGSYWKLLGVQVTDNVNVSTGFLFDLRNGGKTDIIGCLFHPKESNPNWERAVFRGVWYEGTAGLLIQDSYAYGFLGYVPGTTTLNASSVLVSIGGHNVTLTNNFLSAWFATLFTGGGGGLNAHPQQTATFSGSPTMSSATFSNTTGLVPGLVVRIDWLGTGTKSGSTFTQASGVTLTSADVVHGGDAFTAGVGCFFPGSGFTLQVTGISGGSWTFLGSGINNIPSGTQSYEYYQAIRIDSVVGSTVNFTPYGASPLTRALSTTGNRAAWVTNPATDNTANWNIQRNTFWIDSVFANHQQQTGGQIPKGIWEFKHMVGLVVNGNRFTGYPSYLFLPSYSDDGSTPWSTIKDVVISNNFFDFDTFPLGAVSAIDISVTDPYHSNTPGANILIFNNLIKGTQGFMLGKSGNNVQIYHNTVINDIVGGVTFDSAFTWGAPTTNWISRDNIVAFRNFGAQCFFGANTMATCWPSGIWSKNVVVDNKNVGVNVNTWGAGAILGPVPTSFNSVGFTNVAVGNYRLAAGSAYKGLGTSGSDPGIDQDALEIALTGNPSLAPMQLRGSATVSGKVKIGP